MGVGGPGNPGLWKSQTGASVFSSVKRGGRKGWTSWRCLTALAFVIFGVSQLKKSACVRVFMWVGDTAFVTSKA